MKKVECNILVVTFCWIQCGCVVLGQEREAKMTFHVVNEAGNPVSNAIVNGQFMIAGVPGSGWGNYRLNNINGVTDAEGNCVISGKSIEPSGGARILHDGFYAESSSVSFTNSLLDRWLPWNPTVEIVLRHIGIQTPMFAMRIRDKKSPVEGKPFGFDLMIGDWVKPYGQGETADMVFKLDRSAEGAVTNRYGRSKLFDNRLTVSFSDTNDGIQLFAAISHSGLLSPRQAPLAGYQATLTKRHACEEIKEPTPEEIELKKNTRTISNYRVDANYFFRVRTKKDSSGNITNAMYGKIYGDFDQNFEQGMIGFRYYLNPEPNSRNMEFNTHSNLFKNLKPMEQVSAP